MSFRLPASGISSFLSIRYPIHCIKADCAICRAFSPDLPSLMHIFYHRWILLYFGIATGLHFGPVAVIPEFCIAMGRMGISGMLLLLIDCRKRILENL